MRECVEERTIMSRSAQSNIQKIEDQLEQSELVLCFGRQGKSLDLERYQSAVGDSAEKGSNAADAITSQHSYV